jgi:hypothetical protein
MLRVETQTAVPLTRKLAGSVSLTARARIRARPCKRAANLRSCRASEVRHTWMHSASQSNVDDYLMSYIVSAYLHGTRRSRKSEQAWASQRDSGSGINWPQTLLLVGGIADDGHG